MNSTSKYEILCDIVVTAYSISCDWETHLNPPHRVGSTSRTPPQLGRPIGWGKIQKPTPWGPNEQSKYRLRDSISISPCASLSCFAVSSQKIPQLPFAP